MSGWKRWLGNGLLVAGTTLISLGLAEIAVRIVSPRATATSHQDPYGLAMHYPGITRYLPVHDQTISTNSAGMRDREHDLAKDPGTYRILVLGDSFMEAYQVPFESALPSLLEETLARETGRNVEVVNGAVSGWGTDDQLRYLTEYGLEYDPDLVFVAMTLHNDISDNLRQYWHTLEDGRLVSQNREPLPYWEYKSLQFKAFLSVRSQLVQLLRMVKHGSAMQQIDQELDAHIISLFDEPPSENIAFGYDLTTALLERLNTVATESGAEVVAMLLPLQIQLSAEAFNGTVPSPDGTPWDVPGEKPQQVVSEAGARLGLEVVDLLPDFQKWYAEGGEPLFLDYDGHWNVAGHRLATEVVSQRMIAAGVLR